jgi:HPt (histidine-containing phosphotransfer) domain-containing protein
LLDATAILRACGRRSAVLARLCEVFQITLPQHMARVRAALRDRDIERLREAAHKLYGTLGAFSSIAGAAALILEDAARRADLVRCTQHVDQLEAMCTELLEDARALTIAKLSSLVSS